MKVFKLILPNGEVYYLGAEYISCANERYTQLIKDNTVVAVIPHDAVVFEVEIQKAENVWQQYGSSKETPESPGTNSKGLL